MFGRSGSIKLARILGIRVGVDVSWFLVLFLMIFSLSGPFRQSLRSTDGVAYLTAVASALLFFSSLIVHELGHAVVARRSGIEVTGIDLWFLGGLAKLSRDADSPGEEFRIAAAGPLVTLLVIAACFGGGIAAAGWTRFEDALVLTTGTKVSPPLLLLAWLGSINVAVLVLNLIPAFPLDGGRIARALVWRVTGDRGRGTRAAARLGQVFGYGLIGVGIFAAVNGLVGVGLTSAILGWFIAQAARGAVLQSAFTERIDGVRVADIMDPQPVSMAAELPVARALEEYFLRYGWSWFPVVDEAGRFVGLLREESAREDRSAALPVRDVMETAEEWRIDEDQPLQALLSAEPVRRLGALLAVDHEGVLRGVVTMERVRRALAAAVSP
ncbi:MAG: hypothetical protein QOK31_1947 [Solirubrobacteraceae bacterium]|nr:hypothetical protein [Solirubrobacteraceae bacterium]